MEAPHPFEGASPARTGLTLLEGGRRLQVALVEGDPGHRCSLERGLAERGYQVQVCRTSDQAVRWCGCEPGHLDAALLALGTGGLLVARLLRLRTAFKSLPILALASDPQELEAALVPGHGFDSGLLKPCSLDAVIATLTELRSARGLLR